jgi:hypothetical protein
VSGAVQRDVQGDMHGDVVRFTPRAEADASTNLKAFIELARDGLTALVSPDEWSGDLWNVTSSFVRKGRSNVSSWLHFFHEGTLVGRGAASTGVPLDAGFGEFARAYIRYQHSAAPMVFERLKARLDALCHLDAAFRSLKLESDVKVLSANVLVEAVRIGCAGVETKYQRARAIQELFEFCRDRGFLSTPFTWKHGVKKAKDPTERIGDDFAARRASKLPSRKAMDVLALAYCEPKTYRDKLLTAVTAICICVPIRIHEVLQLKADCGCDEERENDAGATVPAFGIRVHPGKGNAPQVKWVPDVMEELAREAVGRLRKLGASGREIAAWYVANPTKVYLPPDMQHLRDAEFITVSELADLVGHVNGEQWAQTAKPALHRLGSGADTRYLFAEFERAVLARLPNDFPLHNGQVAHPYSESLIVIRRGAMRADTVGEGSRVMFEPIGINIHGRWLSGTTDTASVFQRYGFVEEDGSEIEQTSHGFRHWLNDIAHRRGMGALDIAHWSGRDPAQNKFYDHQTPEQFHDQLTDLVEKAGGMGPVFEAADNLPEHAPISRAEFLAAQIGSAHHTDLGACIHDYSLLPCQKFGNCLDCAENVFIKGDAKHRDRIADRHDLTRRQLEAAEATMNEGDYGADLWVADHRSALAKLASMLAFHDDPAIADGTVVNLPVTNADSAGSSA